jgi:predicted O-methyltransferase YrrM
MLSKLISIMLTLLKQPKAILRVLHPSEEESKDKVITKYGLNNGLKVVALDTFLEDKKGISNPYLFLEGGSLPTDLILLNQLAQNQNTHTYFEIGTWRGESAMNVAPFVKKVYTLNLPNEEIKRRGASDEYILQGGMLLNGNNITQLYGDSQTFDFSPYYNSCDMVFVDGDHHYGSVVKDTQNALKMLKNQDSILVWHDYGFSPEEIRWEILLAILDSVPVNQHQYLYHVSNTKCAIFCQKPLPSVFLTRPLLPKAVFEVTVQQVKDL